MLFSFILSETVWSKMNKHPVCHILLNVNALFHNYIVLNSLQYNFLVSKLSQEMLTQSIQLKDMEEIQNSDECSVMEKKHDFR